MIAAIVLAAGISRRMGRNKMLMQLEGKPLVRRAVERAITAGLSPVVVVVGHEPGLIRDALAGVPCEFTSNDNFTGPTSGSLHAGLNALPAAVDATVVMLADMPYVTDAMLRELVGRVRSIGATLGVSRYGEVLAPPLFFRRKHFPELLAWHGEGCGKQVVMKNIADAAIVDWPNDALADVDSPEDARIAGLT